MADVNTTTILNSSLKIRDSLLRQHLTRHVICQLALSALQGIRTSGPR